MDDNNTTQQDNNAPSESETQRLHRLVIPMILDILRTRGEQRQSSRSNGQDRPTDNLWNTLASTNDEPPALETVGDAAGQALPFVDNPISDHMAVDEAENVNRDDVQQSDNMNAEDHVTPPATDQQGQLVPSTTTAPSSTPRRPRYRLVVYFEERESSTDTDSNSSEGEPSFLRAPRDDTRRPSRYVAVFSIDSDAQNMPIIHSAGLQQSPANFDDILNQLFTSYMPKGTPPAKKEIIDALPTTTFSHATCAAQPKCAVCLEEFVEGAEVVALPCSHTFHGEECVKPWLRMHSSCPICRYEMPVDDVEYEEKRRERMAKRVTPAVDDITPMQDVTFDEPPLM